MRRAGKVALGGVGGLALVVLLVRFGGRLWGATGGRLRRRDHGDADRIRDSMVEGLPDAQRSGPAPSADVFVEPERRDEPPAGP